MLDLVKLLPAIAQTIGVILGLLYAVSLFANAVMRAMPTSVILFVEAKLPRLAWLARAARKAGGDAIPALKALYSAAAGHQYEPGGWATHPEADDHLGTMNVNVTVNGEPVTGDTIADAIMKARASAPMGQRSGGGAA